MRRGGTFHRWSRLELTGSMQTADRVALVLLGALWGGGFLFTRIAVPAFGPLARVSGARRTQRRSPVHPDRLGRTHAPRVTGIDPDGDRAALHRADRRAPVERAGVGATSCGVDRRVHRRRHFGRSQTLVA